MTDDEFRRVAHEEALDPDMPEWPRMTAAQRTYVAMDCFLCVGFGDEDRASSYDDLLEVLSVENAAAYCDALQDLGFLTWLD